MDGKINSNENFEEENKHRGRRIFAQVFAGTVCGLLFLNTGAGSSFSPIVVPGISSGNDVIQPTKSQVSWIGSICFIFQALGSLSGGQIINPLGRKKGMIVVCLPHIAAWILLWCANDVTTLLIAMALLGFGTAIFKSPILVYMGETCRPSVRGVLVNYSMLFRYMGSLLAYFIGALLPWRLAAAAMLTIPGVTVLLLFMIPETPIWLLSRGRKEQALKSLQWLRGWVDETVVEKEFCELTIYNENNLRCKICDANTSQCPHTNQSVWKKFQAALGDLKERKSVRPLILAMALFFFSSFTGHVAMKPNFVNIFRTFNMPIDSNWALVGVGIIAVTSNIIGLIVMKKFGKRVVMITCMVIVTITVCLLGMYADAHLPHNSGTYGRVHIAENQSAIPLVLWVTNLFFNASGVVTTPWIIISEIFPFKSRGTCCGFVGAMHYLFVFFAAKTHINLETYLDISGTFYFYAAVTILGIIYVYLALPETENRKQEDIEADFASDRIIFANDIFINAIRRCFGFEGSKKVETVLP